jgi:hypothetical protein
MATHSSSQSNESHARPGRGALRPPIDPPKVLIARIARLHRDEVSTPDAVSLTLAHRELLRRYRDLIAAHKTPGARWRTPVYEALAFLGGQADRHVATLANYDHHKFGPYLGVSDDGAAAIAIREAAGSSPKALALGARRTPLSQGVALDAERLGGVGEVPVGPEEFARIWWDCAGRTLMTTNVGSRVNLRLYSRAPRIGIPAGDARSVLSIAKKQLAATFKPFLDAPGRPRPLIVFIGFDAKRPAKQRLALLRSLRAYLAGGGIAAPRIHRIGLTVLVEADGPRAVKEVLNAIETAQAAGLSTVSVDGVVRAAAESVVSLPGLLNYFSPDYVSQLLRHAARKKIRLVSIDTVDSDTVAREIWSTLNTVRSMGFDLGKYGLFPLSLEECDAVVGSVQEWLSDWCAAPVFYVDQGILSRKQVYAGKGLEQGMKLWLRMVAKHKVKVVLIDTVDKSQGWKILKVKNDPKGALRLAQIARLTQFAEARGVKVLWAGSITLEQAYEFGKLGVFGIYVTTAVSRGAVVTGTDRHDPALAAEKRPMRSLIQNLKIVMEAGYLAGRFARKSTRWKQDVEGLLQQLEQAGTDPIALARILPTAWRRWWRSKAA